MALCSPGIRYVSMVCRVIAAGALFCGTVWAGAVGILWAGEHYLVFNTAMSRSVHRAA